MDDNQYYDRVWAYAEQEDDGNFLFPPSPKVELLTDIGLQKPADFYKARLGQADGAEKEGETVSGYTPFRLGPSIDIVPIVLPTLMIQLQGCGRAMRRLWMPDGTRRQRVSPRPIYATTAKEHFTYFGSGFRHYRDF